MSKQCFMKQKLKAINLVSDVRIGWFQKSLAINNRPTLSFTSSIAIELDAVGLLQRRQGIPDNLGQKGV